MFRLAILLLATSECCFAYQRRGGQIKIPVDEIDSTTTPKSTTEKRTTTPKPTTEKRTTTPKPTTQAKEILSSEEIIELVNKYRAYIVKEGLFVRAKPIAQPTAKVMFEVKNDNSLKDYAKSLVYCKPVNIPNEYSYFVRGSYSTGDAMVREILTDYVNYLEYPHNTRTREQFLQSASILYYKSTRAYCFMQLKSCSPRTNVWLNMLACVFNNRPDAGEQLYIYNSHEQRPGKGCAGNDAICRRAIGNRASRCNRNNGLCVAAEGVTFPPKPCSGGAHRCSNRVCYLPYC